MSISKFIMGLIAISFIPLASQSAQMKLLKTQEKAFFTEDANGFFKGLSLKTKVYILTSRDATKCGATLKRGLKTLSYFCKVDLPDAKNITSIHKHESSSIVNVKHGRLKKKVNVRFSNDGKSVKFSTEFDDTGIDWDISKFNDEFYAVYAKSAQSILAKAMLKNGIKVQTIDKK